MSDSAEPETDQIEIDSDLHTNIDALRGVLALKHRREFTDEEAVREAVKYYLAEHEVIEKTKLEELKDDDRRSMADDLGVMPPANPGIDVPRDIAGPLGVRHPEDDTDE